MIPVARLNHAVLYVRDARLSADFYGRVFGFQTVSEEFGGRAVFMRATDTDNHHDLGLFSVGVDAPRPPRGSVGLYHLAWEVPTIDDLAAAERALTEAGALTGASDHGVSKSLYGADPDGNEFEIMWRVPRDSWGEDEHRGVVRPLDLDAEVARWGRGDRDHALTPDTLPAAMTASDRVAIITGATGGLGRVVTRELGADGLRLVLVGTSMDRLSAMASDSSLAEDRWMGHEADIRTADAARGVVDATVARFGRADILVHLIGGYLGGATLVETPEEDVSAMLDQHLWTTFHMARAVVPHMAEAGWGRIVAVSAPVGVTPAAKSTPYAVGKAAEEAVLGTLAREVVGTGVTVNVLVVRKIDTEHERDAERTPKNAWWTTPEEMADAIRFLCSDEAAALNGVRLPLYGSG